MTRTVHARSLLLAAVALAASAGPSQAQGRYYSRQVLATAKAAPPATAQCAELTPGTWQAGGPRVLVVESAIVGGGPAGARTWCTSILKGRSGLVCGWNANNTYLFSGTTTGPVQNQSLYAASCG